MSPSTSSSTPSLGMPFPIAHYVDCNNFSIQYGYFLAANTAIVEPQTFDEGMKDER